MSHRNPNHARIAIISGRESRRPHHLERVLAARSAWPWDRPGIVAPWSPEDDGPRAGDVLPDLIRRAGRWIDRHAAAIATAALLALLAFAVGYGVTL